METRWTVTVEWPPEALTPGDAENPITRHFDDRYSAWSYYHQWAGAYGPTRVSLLDGETLASRIDQQGTAYGPALMKSLGKEDGLS